MRPDHELDRSRTYLQENGIAYVGGGEDFTLADILNIIKPLGFEPDDVKISGFLLVK